MSTDAVEYCILWDENISFLLVELVKECMYPEDKGRAPREGPLTSSILFGWQK